MTISFQPDTRLYPFTSHFIATPQGRMHYLDEGEGPVLLLVHGTPTWSFLYREVIRILSKKFRCLAPDHIGFGLSDKPRDFDYHPEALGRNIERLMDHLAIPKCTLVVHDYGGPIGLSWALRQPERIHHLVISNSWLWGTADDKNVQRADRLIRSRLGRWLYLRMNMSARWLVPRGFSDRSKLSPEVHRHYTEVVPDAASRVGHYRIARWLAGASGWYEEQRQKMEKALPAPVHLLWGAEDVLIRKEQLEKWQALAPSARLHLLPCGHFCMEEKPEDYARWIDTAATA